MPPRRLTRQQAEALLYREARLLDERRFEEWLALLHRRWTCRLPLADGNDPEAEPSIVYDDRSSSPSAWTSSRRDPATRRSRPRIPSTVSPTWKCWGSDAAATVEVRCNVVVFEVRAGTQRPSELTQQRCLVARCVYRLRYEGAGGSPASWRAWSTATARSTTSPSSCKDPAVRPG